MRWIFYCILCGIFKKENLKFMQRKQCLVKLLNESEGNKFIKYLENEGFENIHKIAPLKFVFSFLGYYLLIFETDFLCS